MEQNTISFYGLKPTRALQHEIEHRLEKWIQRERGWLNNERPWTYSVDIERSGCPYLYHCSVEISTASERLHSQGSARTLHNALTHALKQLRPVQVVAVHQNAMVLNAS